MSPATRLRRNSEFVAVRARGRVAHGPALALGWLPAPILHQRVGFVVSKRVGSAVTRNRVKRRLRAILQSRLASLAPGYDLVITAKPSAAQRSYADLARDVDDLLRRARVRHSDSATQPASDPQEGSR